MAFPNPEVAPVIRMILFIPAKVTTVAKINYKKF
jgi:hypothetical protein